MFKFLTFGALVAVSFAQNPMQGFMHPFMPIPQFMQPRFVPTTAEPAQPLQQLPPDHDLLLPTPIIPKRTFNPLAINEPFELPPINICNAPNCCHVKLTKQEKNVKINCFCPEEVKATLISDFNKLAHDESGILSYTVSRTEDGWVGENNEVVNTFSCIGTWF